MATISMIEHRSAWYDIYDERGKKQKTLSDSIGEVLGWSSSFFIVDTFIMRRSAWLDTYDNSGRKISTRAAH